jgi:hypothetical protein
MQSGGGAAVAEFGLSGRQGSRLLAVWLAAAALCFSAGAASAQRADFMLTMQLVAPSQDPRLPGAVSSGMVRVHEGGFVTVHVPMAATLAAVPCVRSPESDPSPCVVPGITGPSVDLSVRARRMRSGEIMFDCLASMTEVTVARGADMRSVRMPPVPRRTSWNSVAVIPGVRTTVQMFRDGGRPVILHVVAGAINGL